MTRLDLPLMICWAALLGFGLVMVASASAALSETYFSRHSLYLVLAVLAFLAVLAVPLRLWQALHLPLLVAALLLCILLLLPGVAERMNGAKRWISLGGFTLQPGEMAKGAFVLYCAGYLARHDEALRKARLPLFRPSQWLGASLPLLRPILWFVLLAVLLVAQPDLGTAAVLGVVLGALLFLAGMRLRYFLAILLGGGGLLALAAWGLPHVRPRLLSFTDPWADALNSGYQLVNSLIAFGRGELLGLGLGEGIQKLWYLPDAHNDFIYAVVAEELGLLGALLLLGLLAALVLRILRTARLASARGAPFASYLCYGVGLLMGVQTLVNIGVATGSLPTKGLTLPFVSYGGNSLILCAGLLGMVARAQWELQADD